MKTIKLQGISAPQPAIEARELKPGMTRLYNFGETGKIVSVTPPRLERVSLSPSWRTERSTPAG